MFVDTPIDWDKVPIFDEYGNIVRPVPGKQQDDHSDPDALIDASDASFQSPPVKSSSDSSGSTGSVHNYRSSRARSSACTTPTPSENLDEKQKVEDNVRSELRDKESEPENGEDDLQLFGASIFVRGGHIERLPHPMDLFDDIINTDHVAFLFKPGGMDQLYRLFDAHCPILLRRPLGWGIDMFATTFAARIDLRYSYHFEGLRSYHCTPYSTHGLHQDYLLALDFRNVESESESESDVARALEDYIHVQCTDFCRQYRLPSLLSMASFAADENPASSIVQFVTGEARNSVVVLIENFDALPESQYLRSFFAKLEPAVECGWIKGLVLLSDKADARMEECIIRSDTSTPSPKKLETSSFGFKCLLDISHHPAFQTAVGCTESEVHQLDEALALSFPDAHADIFAILHKIQPHPVLFRDPDFLWELPSTHPLRHARLLVEEGDKGVYALNDVYQALTEKYENYGLQSNMTPMR